MGFLRGALVSVIAVVLLISLFVMNATLTLTWSLEYETLKPVIKDIVGDVAQEEFGLEEYLDEATVLMQEYCKNETEFVFSQDGRTFVIPCEEINQGSDAIIDYGVDSLVEGVYYTEYDCEFWQCVKTTDNYLVLISEKAHDYWQSKFLIFLLISIALFILMFIVANKKSNAFILAGFLTILSSLPFMKLTWIARFVPESLKPIFLSFFARSHNVFIIMGIIGLFLFGLGVAFHFLRWGLKITSLFRKHAEEQEDEENDVSKEDVKSIVKKEIAKEKVKQVVKKELSSASKKGSERKKEISSSKGVAKSPVVKKSLKPAKPPIKSNKK